jgi:anti-sigma B factor antagonist/stage II sporulation protein AA (anti-sigma F factor antagonist)
MFEAVVSQEGAVRHIGLNGEFDLEGFPAVAELFKEAFSNGSSAVEVDLRGLTFLDSSGIRSLIMAVRDGRAAGVSLTIIPGPPQVQRVFATAGLLDELPFAED